MEGVASEKIDTDPPLPPVNVPELIVIVDGLKSPENDKSPRSILTPLPPNDFAEPCEFVPMEPFPP